MSDPEHVGITGLATITEADIDQVVDGLPYGDLMIVNGLAGQMQREGRAGRTTPGRLVVDLELSTLNENE